MARISAHTPTEKHSFLKHTQLVVQNAEVLQALSRSVGQASQGGRRHQAYHKARGQPLEVAGVGQQLHEKMLDSVVRIKKEKTRHRQTGLMMKLFIYFIFMINKYC